MHAASLARARRRCLSRPPAARSPANRRPCHNKISTKLVLRTISLVENSWECAGIPSITKWRPKSVSKTFPRYGRCVCNLLIATRIVDIAGKRPSVRLIPSWWHKSSKFTALALSRGARLKSSWSDRLQYFTCLSCIEGESSHLSVCETPRI